ncbi:MAG: DUF1800 domain-containing protein [Alphaproteobacteria bacterium]|nr:DUF1800 domain-containing protein [Alphaproteobacteria bacterium]
MRDVATFIALNRFGLGAAPGKAPAVDSDPRGWVAAQIDKRAAPGTAGGRASAGTLAEMHRAANEGPERLNETARRLYRAVFWPEVAARARHAIDTAQPFAERMALFWSNHFTVSRTRAIVGPAIPAYEREAIRPHVFGRFADMLKAVCRHPCMLSYLDNIISIGPRSDAGRRRLARGADARTLNENLAREILELHTLGVNGGYGQPDVIELAKAITGWSHGGFRPNQDKRPVHGDFEFNPVFHEPGPKTVLGRTYAEAGADEGLAILDDLARHPATARHLATKLVRHFLADDPPADAVARIAGVFQSSDGDLAAVCRALIDLEAVWRAPLPKVKTHYEFVVAVHRALGNTTARAADVVAPFQTLGQAPFTAPSPQGWGDTARHWIAPESLLRRIEWVRSLAGSVPATLQPARFLDDVIGPVAGEPTRQGVTLAPSGDAAIALVLASAEFQRR